MSVHIILEAQHKERLDKWLWMARFFKTRRLATEFVDRSQVLINQQKAKPAKEVKLQDVITFTKDHFYYVLTVTAFSSSRGCASIAALLYAENSQTHALRLDQAAKQKLMHEPAREIKGKPSRRDRPRMKYDQL